MDERWGGAEVCVASVEDMVCQYSLNKTRVGSKGRVIGKKSFECLVVWCKESYILEALELGHQAGEEAKVRGKIGQGGLASQRICQGLRRGSSSESREGEVLELHFDELGTNFL